MQAHPRTLRTRRLPYSKAYSQICARIFRSLCLWVLLATSTAVMAEEIESAIARGGRLYDMWWLEKGQKKPKSLHPAFSKKDEKFTTDSWRCKECHGWDYQGRFGDYATGPHATGIKGIDGAIGKNPASIAGILRDKNHRYTAEQLDDKDIADLALFVTRGQIRLSPYFDLFGKPRGSSARGEVYYATICGGCHKPDGAGESRSLGDAGEDRAETIHKIFNGQPGEDMPALRALDPQITLDIAAHITRLPNGKRR